MGRQGQLRRGQSQRILRGLLAKAPDKTLIFSTFLPRKLNRPGLPGRFCFKSHEIFREPWNQWFPAELELWAEFHVIDFKAITTIPA
jgi:hypothetical protein